MYYWILFDFFGICKLTPDFSGVRVTRSLVWCVCFVDRFHVLFILLLLAIVLSVLLLLAIVLSVLLLLAIVLSVLLLLVIVLSVLLLLAIVLSVLLLLAIVLSVLLLLAIVLSVLLQFTDSNYPFGIFKLFLYMNKNKICLYFINTITTMYYVQHYYLKHVLSLNPLTESFNMRAINLNAGSLSSACTLK